MAIWKKERQQLFAGRIYPIGNAPDGVSWIGFASVSANRGSGYLLLFRELSDKAEWSLELPLFTSGAHRVTVLAGNGSAELAAEKLTTRIPATLQYLWVKVD